MQARATIQTNVRFSPLADLPNFAVLQHFDHAISGSLFRIVRIIRNICAAPPRTGELVALPETLVNLGT